MMTAPPASQRGGRPLAGRAVMTVTLWTPDVDQTALQSTKTLPAAR